MDSGLEALAFMSGPSTPPGCARTVWAGGRDLLSEASSPGSDAPCRERRAGRGVDTPATFTFRVDTFTAGTASAFGRSFAPRYGSDLLPLRLRFAFAAG
jgi:hypothetical protein